MNCTNSHKPSNTINMARVTGIGGIFFKCKNPEQSKIELWEAFDEEYNKIADARVRS